MAQATKKNVDVAGRRVAKKGEAEFARYDEKDVTPVISDFADWLQDEVGGSLATLSKRDRKILFIGSALRGEFQKSDFNQNRIAQRKEEIAAEAEARAERKQERETARLEREAAAKEKKSAPAKTKTAAPAKTGKSAGKSAPATKSAPAKSGTTRRRPVATKGSKGDF